MKFNLTQMEQDILELLWQTGSWTSGAEFWEYFNSHSKPCKRQTVNTYLTRMTEKGLLVKNKRKYMYAFTEEEFQGKRAEEVLNSMYHGQIKNFVAALGGFKKFSKEEVADLKEYLDQLEESET